MPANVNLTDDPLVQQSTEALSTMEKEAAEFFAARASEQNKGDGGLNPLAAALDKAVKEPPKAEKPAAKAPPAPKTGKVAGAPTFAKKAAEPAVEAKPTEAKAEVPATEKVAEKPAVETADPFADVPREFKPKHWDKLHAKADHYAELAAQHAAERDTLKAELEALRANPSTTADVQQRLTTLQQERDTLRAQLETVAGERIFDAESKPRREAALALAKSAVSPADAEKVASILSLPESTHRDNAIEELLATLPPLRATKLAQAVASLDQLTAERAAAAAQGSTLWNQRMAQQQAQQEKLNQERIARAAATFDAELKEWEPVGLTAEDIANARSVYSGQGATLQDASRAALWAVAGPRAAQMASDLQARVAELEGELSKLRGAQPGVGAAAGGALPSAGDDDIGDAVDYSTAIAKHALKAGVRFGGA